MLINILVVSITMIALVFVAIWSLFPGLRSSIEAPKYPLAHWDEERPAAVKMIRIPLPHDRLPMNFSGCKE